MKRYPVVLALAFSCALSSGALASEKAKSGKPTKTSAAPSKSSKASAPSKESKVELTGSYIKQDIRRNGHITDSQSPVYVIDSQAIQTSGASDLRQLLVKRGFGY